MAETTEPNPTKPPDRRKLIAVVYADMVGYSRLIGLDDGETAERLHALRSTLIDPAIDEHGGRIVQTAGDSLLILFDSIDGAVRCAVKVQHAVPSYDGDHPHGRAIRFRVGIDIGDVIPDGTDFHGNAVNVAARLQAECPPGSICVTRAVRDHVHDRLNLVFDEIGPLNLKNINRPIEAFVLRSDAASRAAGPTVQAHATSSQAKFLEFDGQHAIAVLPFHSYTQDDEPLTDELTDELINALSAWRSFPVIARTSVFAYRGRNADVRVIGRALGARYIVSGGARRHGSQVRVTLELVDVETAENLLSEFFDHSYTDPFALLDDIVRTIAGVLAPEVLRLEREHVVRRPPTEASVYELYQRGMWHRVRHTKEHHERAQALFRQALQIDPGYTRATVALSLCLNFAAISRWVPDLQSTHAESLALARQGVAEDPRDPHAHFAFGVACMNARRLPEAISELCAAVRLNPSHAYAHANLGQVLNYLNRPDEGLPQIELALRLNPRDPMRFMWLPYLATSHYLLRRYKECLAACEQALVTNPGYPHAARYMVAALGQLGMTAEAKPLFGLLRRYDGDFAGLAKLTQYHFVPEAAEHLLEGFRRAGFT